MPTRAAEPQEAGVGTAAKQVAGHASRLAKLRLELAKLELRSKATGVGLGIGAAILALYALGFLLASVAVALSIVLDAWLALLLLTFGLFVVAAALGLTARAKLGGSEKARSNGNR